MSRFIRWCKLTPLQLLPISPSHIFQGTIRYCAPEVLQNKPPDSFADIFSFAVLMWQLKEGKIPYASIHANETIIWNVVKKDMRPDSLKLKFVDDEPPMPRKYLKLSETSQCKSDSSFLRVAAHLPLTPKLSNQKLPEILINKLQRTGERNYRQKLKVKRQPAIRKKLFSASFSPNFDGEAEVEEVSDESMRDLFIDHQHFLRSPEKVQLIETKYVQMYRSCWHRDKSKRLSALKVHDSIEKWFNYL
jgi:serine/threonine protein kinase